MLFLGLLEFFLDNSHRTYTSIEHIFCIPVETKKIQVKCTQHNYANRLTFYIYAVSFKLNEHKVPYKNWATYH